MRRIGLAIITLTSLVSIASADPLSVTATPEPVAKNAIYLELGGAGGLYTLNYERFVAKDMSIRAGLGYISLTASATSGDEMASAKASWTSVPLMFNYLGIAHGGHALELAGGVSLMRFTGAVSTFDATESNSASGSTLLPVGTAVIGYRYSQPTGGFTFRAGYTPLIFLTTEDKGIAHWGGMSFGYRFR
jgi:hypothetical protein